MSDDITQASGVQKLIDRLQHTGVEEGRTRGEQVFDEARRKAEQLLADARNQADQILRDARDEAERTRAAGEEAVRLAVRDAILNLREQLAGQFSRQMQRMVSHTLQDQEFLRELIREIARGAVPEQDAGRMEILLPPAVATQEELRRKPDEVREGPLGQFALSVTSDLLREGLTFRTGSDDSPGITVRLVDKDVEIDLTDEAISDLLLRHLLPRFRVMLDGIVR